MSIKFMLNDKLQKNDSLGEGYVYEATEHPIAKDIMIVHFNDDGDWGTANYKKDVFESMFKEGHWIKV